MSTKETHIFAESLEPEALRQFEEAMEQPFAVKGCLLPDAHTGYSLPIGAVVATDNMVLPSWVGFDIGCGVAAVPTSFDAAEVVANADRIFQSIYRAVPVGFNHNQKESSWPEYVDLLRTDVLYQIFKRNGLRQLGSLGGGNHFIEIGKDEANVIWVIVHSGSRGIGHSTATHYMKLASGSDKAKEGHFGFAADSPDGQAYITDMDFCLAFALENRRQLLVRVVWELSYYCKGTAFYSEMINRNHNHAEQKDGLWIHRKGATHAEAGMMGVIPGNMRDGSFIVEGLGNPDSLYSSSHGAGRVMGRGVAKRTLSLQDFSDAMAGVTAKVDAETLDESPAAYKDIFDVMRQQSAMVTVKRHIRPLINIKG